MEPQLSDSAPVAVDLGVLYQEIQAAYQDAERRASELRGQLRLIERLIGQAQRPTLSGDPLGESS